MHDCQILVRKLYYLKVTSADVDTAVLFETVTGIAVFLKSTVHTSKNNAA